MSRIAKKPLSIPMHIKFDVNENKISFSGRHGELSYEVDPSIKFKVENNFISSRLLTISI